jgi:hypothetical protein
VGEADRSANEFQDRSTLPYLIYRRMPARFRAWSETIKHLLLALSALALLATAVPAKAHCPPGTTYDCTQMPNGKMSCGCR